MNSLSLVRGWMFRAALVALCIPWVVAARAESIASDVQLSDVQLNGNAGQESSSIKEVAAVSKKPCAEVAPCDAKRAGDEEWIVSSRGLGCSATKDVLDRLQYMKLEGGKWTRQTRAAFFDSGADLTTEFYLHGYNVESGQDRGLESMAYRAFAKQSPENRKMKFVFWSWPSGRMSRRPLQDVRARAGQADFEAYYFAQLLGELKSTSPVGLIGYSYGARIVTGALHLRAGGKLIGRSLAAASENSLALRPVLFAAALDSDWLMPGHYNGKALQATDKMLIVTNGCDPILMRYHLLYCRRSCAQALGYTGPVGLASMGDNRAKISQFDVCCQIGSTHDWSPYFYTPSVLQRICDHVYAGTAE